jgi:hypothetical protein
MTLDRRSRKVLRYVKKKGQASRDEIMKLSKNEGFTDLLLTRLNMREYIIKVKNEEPFYELQEKGYEVLEEFRRQAITSFAPILISLASLMLSVFTLVITYG